MLLTVVGNPTNRRVTGFVAAARSAGLAPRVLSWLDVLAGRAAPGPQETVRIDSPGEDAEVDRVLRGAATPAEHGEIVGTAAAYAGLCRAVDRLAGTGALLLNQAADIAVAGDKRRCHALLAAAGVPAPPALPDPVDGYPALRAGMRAAGWNRVFVKPAHGSSASGVLALTAARGRVQAVTSVELAGDRLYNSLRVRRYDTEAEIATIVDRLAPDGLHVERWYPKAGLGDRVLDLRVVVVAGRPTHVVVRTGSLPITNLHLGNARGDLAAVREAAGPAGYAAALATCERVAACFPASLHVGVDLMFHADWRQHAVAEVNAFGDLLPGVLHEGRDTYAEQVDALVGGRFRAARGTVSASTFRLAAACAS